ncbi:MAG TPA: Dam family site-specific DNA-(adenine-N6)-methyltransferase [Candidatus Nitrosocosmicus sp.]|nr:Dam family site-specific DNA-(adenine-N6)-methyltransferase [Candidatus Nitrosocosmicus sp.]
MYKTNTTSFLKWAGGKRRLVTLLDKYTPTNIDRYFEPFLGSGAFFFHLVQSRKQFKAYLSDSNPHLINTYREVRDNLNELIEILMDHQNSYHKNGEKYYYSVRDDQSNKTNTEAAAKFIFLNKTCYNGLYRVNKLGNFNVPHGRYFNPKICNKEKLIECSSLLNKAEVKIVCDIYKNTTLKCKDNDFVYLDPPYFPVSRTSNFTDYTKESFGIQQHQELANEFDRLDSIGSKVLLSNSNSEYVKSLYKNYFILKVKSTRSINCNADRRSAHHDLIISNYNKRVKDTEKVTHKVNKKLMISKIVSD